MYRKVLYVKDYKLSKSKRAVQGIKIYQYCNLCMLLPFVRIVTLRRLRLTPLLAIVSALLARYYSVDQIKKIDVGGGM